MALLGPYRGYNTSVDASISNVFATAAMRFGHTLVRSELIRQLLRSGGGGKNRTAGEPKMKMRKLFFASHLLYEANLGDTVLAGLMATPLKKPMPEQAISAELTEHLFERSREAPLDLASINIQRGRDHALPGYNDWRAFCGLRRADNFEQLAGEIRNAAIREKLARLYGHPDNVDLWVGGILEDVASEDAKVGPTFRCLLVEQFRRLRDGDRHWYEAEGIFSRAQLAELKKTSLSEIICENSDGAIKEVPTQAFTLSQNQPMVKCSALPKLDLQKW